MVKAIVNAQSFDPENGVSTSKSKGEVIDTDTNVLFKNCKTLTDITETYMRFWNRLPTTQYEMVLVQSIRWV